MLVEFLGQVLRHDDAHNELDHEDRDCKAFTDGVHVISKADFACAWLALRPGTASVRALVGPRGLPRRQAVDLWRGGLGSHVNPVNHGR